MPGHGALIAPRRSHQNSPGAVGDARPRPPRAHDPESANAPADPWQGRPREDDGNGVPERGFPGRDRGVGLCGLRARPTRQGGPSARRADACNGATVPIAVVRTPSEASVRSGIRSVLRGPGPPRGGDPRGRLGSIGRRSPVAGGGCV